MNALMRSNPGFTTLVYESYIEMSLNIKTNIHHDPK